MAGFVDGTVSACDVLFLVPELLFLAFMVVAILGLITSSTRGGGRSRSVNEENGGSGWACFTGVPATPLAAAGVAAVVAAMVIPAVAVSLKVVLQAPVAAVATAALMAVLAVVTLVVVLTMLAVGMGFSATMFARIYGRFK